jgi:hypothetical protein
MTSMSKKKEFNETFTSQPYPLYAWGMWVEPVFDDSFSKIVSYEFNVDRLTIVGWMHEEDVVVPMVSSTTYGVIPLYAFTGAPLGVDIDFPSRYPIVAEEFNLVDITMAEPAREVFEAAKEYYHLVQRAQRMSTVVEEAYSDI